MPDAVHVRGKSFKVCRGRNSEFWESVSKGEWEPETFAIFDRYIDKDHSYIDIGAWIGPTLLYGSQIARRSFGLEPDPIAFRELEQNIELNKPVTDRTHIYNCCIAPSSGTVAFGSRNKGGDSASSLLFARGKTRWEVQARTFDDFVRENGIDDCNFIKMDIEGGEYLVLPTLQRYLRKQRPTLHLSLHPLFLGDLSNRSFLSRLRRPNFVPRLLQTLKILRCLRFYKHVYDRHGRKLSLLRLLWTCRARIGIDVVFTDIEFSTT